MSAKRLSHTTAERRVVEIKFANLKEKSAFEISLFAGVTGAPDTQVGGPYAITAETAHTIRVGYAARTGDFVEVRSTDGGELPEGVSVEEFDPEATEVDESDKK